MATINKMAEVVELEEKTPQNEPDLIAAIEKKERVKARWSLLREALIGTKSSAAKSKHSMNAFGGFQVLERNIIQDAGEQCALLDMCNDLDNDGQAGEESTSWDFVRNAYTCKQGRKIQFVTREKKQQSQQTLQLHTPQSTMKRRVEALLSHRNHGVDNTGNVRVWDAESTLAGFLLSICLSDDVDDLNGNGVDSKLIKLRLKIKAALIANEGSIFANGHGEKCNIIEVGAGQAGLAGFALTSATTIVDDMKSLQLILTDGHPKCVDNNKYCSKLVPKRNGDIIDSRLLLWDSSASGAEECQRITGEYSNSDRNESSDDGNFHICLASDCIHFQEFHDGLFATIARTLRVGGIAILCQPKRGSSLTNFMSVIDNVNNASASNEPLFEMDLYNDFHQKVSKMHRDLESTNSTFTCYDPNWHRPLLLVLTKLRSFDEDVDGELARDTVKAYASVK